MELRALKFIEENHLIPPASNLLVAVSGGADSICMLHILLSLRERMGINLHIAHLDHQLRGAESAADARYIEGLSFKLKVPATISRADVAKYQREKCLTMEDAAREVRYGFLTETAQETGSDRIAVGHTQDDHIETVLMHLVRGTGLNGLQGLKPSVNWQSTGGKICIIRPLLNITRSETSTYCDEKKLRVRIDASNFSLPPLRNRLRHQLLPLLKEYNPAIEQSILRLSRIAADDIEFLEEEAKRAWEGVARYVNETVTLDRSALLKQPAALKREVIRLAFERLLGNLKDVEARHIDEVIDALDKPAGKKLNLPGGLYFSTEYECYRIGRGSSPAPPIPPLSGERELSIPGDTQLTGWLVKADITAPQDVRAEENDNPYRAYLDLGITGTRLSVRNRRPGDRFQPQGMKQSKKLGEYMIDNRVPSYWRERVPLVCSPEQIIWVVGWRIDERVKITANTKQVLRIDFIPQWEKDSWNMP